MARLFGPFLVFSILLLDQIVKYTVTELFFRPALQPDAAPVSFIHWLTTVPEKLGAVSLAITSFFNLTMVWNTGISFGFLGQEVLGDNGDMILTVVSLLIAGGFFYWMMKSMEVAEIIALAMIVGGALGNVIDRVRFGAVVDFFDFHWQGAHFPSFNIADASISIGVAVLLIHSLFFAKNTD